MQKYHDAFRGGLVKLVLPPLISAGLLSQLLFPLLNDKFFLHFFIQIL